MQNHKCTLREAFGAIVEHLINIENQLNELPVKGEPDEHSVIELISHVNELTECFKEQLLNASAVTLAISVTRPSFTPVLSNNGMLQSSGHVLFGCTEATKHVHQYLATLSDALQYTPARTTLELIQTSTARLKRMY